MKLIVEGDRHIKSQHPFNLAHYAYNDWVVQQPWNNPETIWFSEGDWYNTSYPDPEENAIALDFLHRTNFNRYIIQAGNHEYSRPKDRYSLSPLEKLGVEILYQETVLNLGSLKILSLPFYYPYLRQDVGRMEEYYSRLHELPIGQDEYDFIFGHLYFMNDFGSYCDMTNLKGKKFFGHDHGIRSNEVGEYLGSPMPTSYTQRGQRGHLLLIDLEDGSYEYIDVPMFLDYATVKYPDPLPLVGADYVIWDVEGVVDKETTIEHYQRLEPNITFREFHTKDATGNDSEDVSPASEQWSLSAFLASFYEKNSTPIAVQTIINDKVNNTA